MTRSTIRERLATIGLGLAAALLGLLGAGTDGPGAARSQLAAPALAIYQVVAPLLSVRGGPIYACAMILSSLPPAGCGGVRVEGIAIQQVPKVERFKNGTLMTPTMRLVGSWDGQVLTLTEAPRAAASGTGFPRPCMQAPGTMFAPGVPPRQMQIVNDQTKLESQSIHVLETVTCGDTLGIVVEVADPGTVQYLESHYGKVSVKGWLEPVAGLPSGY